MSVTFVLGLSLSALSVNRANRPVTRWCRHGASIVMAFMICVMHYALTASSTPIPDASVLLSRDLIPAKMLGVSVVAAVLLVMGSGFSSYIIDLRSRTESAERIHQLSFNDAMTGLPNRIAFNERLAFDVSDAHEKAHRVAVFSIDLDGFKDVNDVFGHSAGDLLLIEAADRMRRRWHRVNFSRVKAATSFWDCRCPVITRWKRKPLPSESHKPSRIHFSSRPACRSHGIDRLFNFSYRHARARPTP